MPFISVTRLRLRSIRYLPSFAVYTLRSLGQVKRSPGFQSGNLLLDQSWTFWTMTAWDSEESMRGYMTSGPHKAAMPKLLDWCDEASVVHWFQEETVLPAWTEADTRMRASGRASKVRNPSPQHASLSYLPPRAKGGGPIHRVSA